MHAYGRAANTGELKHRVGQIQDDLVSILGAVQRGNRDEYCMMMGPDDQFNAEQNAEVVIGFNPYPDVHPNFNTDSTGGEEYFRKSADPRMGGQITWNTRDQHMTGYYSTPASTIHG